MAFQIVGNVPQLNSGCNFEKWTKVLEACFISNDIAAEEKKRAWFILGLGREGYQTLRMLLLPAVPTDKMYEECKEALMGHFLPKPPRASRGKEPELKRAGSLSKDEGQVQNDKGQVQKDKGQMQKDKGQVQKDKGQVQKDTSQVQRDTSQVQRDTSQVQRDTSQVQYDTGQVQNDTGQVLRDNGQMQSGRSQRQREIAIQRATLAIQAAFRGMKIRREIRNKQKAATVIQAACRRHRVYRQYKAMRLAAIIVQTHYRAHLQMESDRKTYMKVRRSVVLLQAAYRGMLVRS
ncbi:abnormal spindle-like microcephaly-associated protein homolog isoform X1 [Leucoraja erinacea]|uniref:abnormal spindle-like microcephaly-associated protein homolog isoform X1 n=1 Tax=Leucoraja erinaceus TaxID=7782 RepID=UPI0024549820|nr:abnormal spindle-like microcephaly-associated protein homolog isoform X1 [Leucoraja erinacea]